MKYPIFIIFLMFLAWFSYNRIRVEKRDRNRERAFWEREENANSTRRKDISSLPYIVIPLESLPFGVSPRDEALSRQEDQIRTLSQEKILNLTGITNTELKLTYGAPNLTFLTQCDQNFTELVRVMQYWGSRLYELALIPEAETVLSLAIHWGSDLKSSYQLLASIYRETGKTAQLEELKTYARSLNSLRKQSILDALS